MINIGNAKHIIDNIPTSLNVCRQKQQYPSSQSQSQMLTRSYILLWGQGLCAKENRIAPMLWSPYASI